MTATPAAEGQLLADLESDLEGWRPVPYRPRESNTLGSGGCTFVVVRESNIFDLLAFATMIRQVLEPIADRVPGVREILDLTGADAELMRNDERGAKLRRQLNAEALYQEGRPYGWVFQVSGTVFLFAMTSAFSDAGEDLNNSFTDDLITQLQRFKPSVLVTGPSTRLVRRKDLGETLGRQAGLLGIRIFTKEAPEGLDLRAAGGSTMWTLLCLLAEQDLRYTLTRLLTGRIHAVRVGQWLAGEGALPLGFALDEAKRPVAGDNRRVAQARLLLELAAEAADELDLPEEDRTLSPEVILKRLAAAGAKKRSNKKADKQGNPIAGTPLDTVTSPTTTLKGLLSVLPAYGPEGVLKRMQGLPMTGLDRHDVHGHTIYKKRPDDLTEKGAICFEWEFPKPMGAGDLEEEWAQAETLAKAKRYFDFLSSRPGTSSGTRSWPLVGLFKGTYNGAQYSLVHNSAGYQWKRFTQGGPVGGVAVGKFSDELTVLRLVDAIVEELERLGIDPAEVAFQRPTPRRSPANQEIEALAAQVDDLVEALEKACALVRDETVSPRQKQLHQAAADEAERMLAEAERRFAKAQAGSPPEEQDPDILMVGDFATLLSVLYDTAGGQVDPRICELLARYIDWGTVEDCWDEASPWGTFHATVAVPTAHGSPRRVDVRFEVPNTTQGPDRKSAFPARYRRLVELRMTSSITLDELAQRLDITTGVASANLHEAMQPFFEYVGLAGGKSGPASRAASAILDCPIDSTRSVVWALLNGLSLPETIEDLTEEQTARHIEDLRATWLSPDFDWKSMAWSSGGERTRRQLVRWVEAQTPADDSTTGAPVDALLAAFGLESSTALTARYLAGGVRAHGTAVVIERAEWGTLNKDKRVRLRSCPHCGHRGLHPVACVEFGDDPVLCPNCRRHPENAALVRPSSYLQNFEGPYGRSRVDSRAARLEGERVGTVIGPPTAMPSPTRTRRAQKARVPRKPRPTTPRLCKWPGCERHVPPTASGRGRPRAYCGEDGHSSRAAVKARVYRVPRSGR